MRRRAAEKDADASLLPATRGAQYGDMLRHRPMLFAAFGGINLLFGLPFLTALSFNELFFLPAEAARLSKEEYARFLNTNSLVFDAVYGVCLLILLLGHAGKIGVMKRWAWGEGVFFWRDFGRGIRENWLSFACSGLLFSLLYLAADYAGMSLPGKMLPLLPMGLVLLLIEPLLLGDWVRGYYQEGVFRAWGAGFRFLAKCPGEAFLFFLLYPALLALLMIPKPFFEVLSFALALLLLPFYEVGWHLFSLSLFDEFTNAESYPSYYHKGLRDEFEDE